ncbi:hypothetical protein [Streptomyces fragilis]|nr:hypothetical protein [Streptomyces fragilis]
MGPMVDPESVSYTHLDVYKRQTPSALARASWGKVEAVRAPRR